MKALMLVADGVEDLEFFYPFYRLKENNFEVHVAGPNVGTVTGKHGYTVETDLSFSGIKSADYDILVLPGGKAPETVRMHPDCIEVTKKMMQSGKLVATICHGVQTLISADVLKGRTCTCWRALKDDVKAAGANYVDKEVVVDDNLISSRSPGDLPAFCREIVHAVESLASVST